MSGREKARAAEDAFNGGCNLAVWIQPRADLREESRGSLGGNVSHRDCSQSDLANATLVPGDYYFSRLNILETSKSELRQPAEL